MEQVISKRHPVKFYGVLIFISLPVIALTLIFIAQGALYGEKQFKLLIPFVLFLFVIYSIFRYRKNTPSITIKGRIVSFDKRSYSIDDIERIDFTGKQNFKYLLRFPMEGAMIVFKNMQVEYIFDDMYKNTSELKKFLDYSINNKEFNPVKAHDQDVSGEYFYYYKGNFFLNIRGISFTAFLAFYLIMILKADAEKILMLSIFCIGFMLLLSMQFKYFGLNNRYFIVKNYILFWKRDVYRISDIKEIVYETQGKMPNCLRIITKDYRNKLYLAATVRNSEWLEMKTLFEKEGIIVRNECI